MPTLQTDGRTHPKLPDIFRTINGVNVDLGPLDRLRDADGEGATANTGSAGPLSWGRGKEGDTETSGGMCPRIILRDALGRQLDTFTTLQEAIYRAKWNVQQTGQAKTPIEWRLPKAPPPARPDLTRTFPPLKHPPVHGEGGAKGRPAVNHSRVLEFDVKDVGFVQESLQYLPYAPSLSFLRQEILVGPKTYFQIVGTLLLHKRILSQTEKRQAVHNFPGFCSGCIRMGLCYGCERSTQPHFHEDKPVKTGGGFTYYKKDRPEHEIPGKNPINWKIQHPDRALKKLMEDFAGVELEGALPEEIKRHLDKHGGHRERLVTSDTTGGGIRGGDQTMRRQGTLADIQVRYGDHGDDHGDDLEGGGDSHAIHRSSGDSINRSRDHVLDPSEVDIEMLRSSAKYGQGDMSGYQGHHSSIAGSETDQHGRVLGGKHYGKAVPGSELTGYDRDTMAKHAGGQGANALNQGKGNHYERFQHRLPKLRQKESDDLEKRGGQEGDSGSEMDGQTDTDTDTTSRGRRKKRLYKPPPAFKLKKSPHRSIDSRSPFSTDRNYDLPKGSGFQLKKSDKKLTEFKDFRNVDVSWKEPKKFELKKIETKTTTFWSGSPKKKEKSRSKSRSPDRKIRRVPSPCAVSPDSGLDSEQLTGSTRFTRGKLPGNQLKRVVEEKPLKNFNIFQPRSTAISPIHYERESTVLQTNLDVNQDSAEDWNETADEIKKLYEGKMTLSDLDSEVDGHHHMNKVRGFQNKKNEDDKIHGRSRDKIHSDQSPTYKERGLKSSGNHDARFLNGHQIDDDSVKGGRRHGMSSGYRERGLNSSNSQVAQLNGGSQQRNEDDIIHVRSRDDIKDHSFRNRERNLRRSDQLDNNSKGSDLNSSYGQIAEVKKTSETRNEHDFLHGRSRDEDNNHNYRNIYSRNRLIAQPQYGLPSRNGNGLTDSRNRDEVYQEDNQTDNYNKGVDLDNADDKYGDGDVRHTAHRRKKGHSEHKQDLLKFHDNTVNDTARKGYEPMPKHRPASVKRQQDDDDERTRMLAEDQESYEWYEEEKRNGNYNPIDQLESMEPNDGTDLPQEYPNYESQHRRSQPDRHRNRNKKTTDTFDSDMRHISDEHNGQKRRSSKDSSIRKDDPETSNLREGQELKEDSKTTNDNSVIFYEHLGSFKHGYVKGRKGRMKPIPISRIGTLKDLEYFNNDASETVIRDHIPSGGFQPSRQSSMISKMSVKSGPMSSSRMSIPDYSSTQGDRNSFDGISRLDSQNSQRGGQGQNGLGQRTKSSAELGSKAYLKEYQRRYSKHVEDGRPSTSYSRLSENETDKVGRKHSQLPVLPHTTNSKSKPKDRLNKMNYPIQVKIKYHGEERHTEPTFNGEEDERGEEHVNNDNQDHRRENEDVDDAEATELMVRFENYLQAFGNDDVAQLDDAYVKNKYEEFFQEMEEELDSRIKENNDRNENNRSKNKLDKIKGLTNRFLERNRKKNLDIEKQKYQVKLQKGKETDRCGEGQIMDEDKLKQISKGKYTPVNEEYLTKSPDTEEILSGFEDYLKSLGHDDDTQLDPDYIHMKYEKYMNNLKKERKSRKNGVYKKNIYRNEDPKVTNENSLIQTFKGKNRQDDEEEVIKSQDTAEILSGFENYLKSLGHRDSTQLEPEYVHESYERYMNRLKEKRSLQQNGVFKKENQNMGMVSKDVPHADQRQELQAILSELLPSRNQKETKAKESDNSENTHVARDQNEILSGFQNYLMSTGSDDISYLDEDYVKAEFKDYLKEIDEEGKAMDRGMDKRRKGENRSNEVKASKRNLFQNSQLKNTGKSTLAHEERNSSIVEDNKIIIHLHTDSFNRISPPPSVPTGLDFDQGSITSNEPDLELSFDDVIDVEQLEGIDAIEQIDPEEYERKMKEERERKRKHKQKKRRKKREAGKDITAEIAESVEVKHGHDMEDDNIDPNENKNVGEHSQKQKKHKRRHKKYVERDDEMDDYIDDYADTFDEETAEEVKDLDCIKRKSERNMVSANVDNDTDDEKPVNDNKMEKENSNISANTDLDSRKGRTKKKQKKLKPKKTEFVGKEIKADRNNSKDRNVNMIDTSIDANEKLVAEKKTEKKKKTRKNKSKERNAGKKKASKKRPSMFGINIFDMENAETAHAKLGSEAVSDYEIEIEKLPSIRNQLAKILGPTLEKQIADNEKHDESELDEIPGNESDDLLEDTNEIETKDEQDKGNENQYPRPLSARLDDVLGDNGAMRKKYRSMSLPLQSDVEKLIKNMNEMSVEELKKPIHIPVYLPAFPQRKIIMKKQFKSNTTNRSELEPVREETTITLSPEPVMEREITPQPPIIKSPDIPKSVTPPPKKKREIVKKEKKVAPKPRTPEPPPPPSPEPTLPPITKASSPSPEPSDDEPQPSREISFVRVHSIPELPPIEVPELPDIPEKQPYESKVVKKEMKVIEVTPELPEPKKKLPPPPKLGPKIKSRTTSRKSKVAEAPVTAQEIQQLTDPLDFLAKYCIINPDRLPFYERIFNGAVSVQSPRYVHQQSPSQGAPLVKLPPAQLSAHELAMLKDLTVISHAQSPRKEGMSVPEQYLEKLNYSIEFIQGKQESIQEHMHALQNEKVQLMAQIAKSMDRDIVRLDYKGKGKKKKKDGDDDDEEPSKKKKKKKSSEGEYDLLGSMVTALKNFRPTKASDITDEVIVSRMDEKMMKKAKKDPAVKTLSLGINRDIEKLKAYEQRISQIEDEKDLVGLYCMDYYFNEQNARAPPYEFRRQQSRLYQKLHPDPDIEMNLDEVEAALQQVNNKLLTQKEFQYIYFVLDLPKREKINFRMFSIVAALSEKVTQMDPVIRKLINKVDHNALDVKMEKSKELFKLLQDESQLPLGNCTADLLAVELTAGGLTPEHTSYVLSKFNREGRGFADFLDFVTYVPLFIEIHKRIIEDPFNETLNV